MNLFVRSREILALALLVAGLIVDAPQARADDAFVLRQHMPTLQSLTANAASGPAGTAAAGPICDIFANGYDSPAAGPCASCFDSTTDFGETDVDCGGAYCNTCASGLACLVGADCKSGTCTNKVCVDATDHLLISQVQTRGDGGAADEFVELYNATSIAVTFDSTWTLTARSSTSSTYIARITGAGEVIPAHGHILFTGSDYNAATTNDDVLSVGITDASSVLLLHNGNVVDALCFYYDAATLALYSTDLTYICEGTPVSNLPHNNTASGSSNTDASLERKPGGALGNAQDTGDNASDFASGVSPDPHNLASPATP